MPRPHYYRSFSFTPQGTMPCCYVRIKVKSEYIAHVVMSRDQLMRSDVFSCYYISITLS